MNDMQPLPPTIVPLRESALPDAAAALARAFQDDPLQTYVFPDPAERVARSPGHFTPLLRYGLKFGEVLTTTDPSAGAAVWLGPEASYHSKPSTLTGANGIASISDSVIAPVVAMYFYRLQAGNSMLSRKPIVLRCWGQE